MAHKDLRKKCRSGFTIVELLVAFAIFSIVMAIMYGLYVTGMDISATSRYQTELQSESRAALAAMVAELRGMTRTWPQSPQPPPMLAPNASIPASPNNTSIAFYPPTIDSDGGISWNTTSSSQVSYVYDAAQRVLKRVWTENNEPRSIILARNVSSAKFEDIYINNSLGVNEVRMILTLTKTTRVSRSVSVTARALATLRN